MNRKKLAYPIMEKDYEQMSLKQLTTFLEDQQSLLNYLGSSDRQHWRWPMIQVLSLIFTIFILGCTGGKLFGSDTFGIFVICSLFLWFIWSTIWSCIIYFWVKRRPCYATNIHLLRCILVAKKQQNEKHVERMEVVRRIAVKKMKEICDTYNIQPTVLWNDLKANVNPHLWYV